MHDLSKYIKERIDLLSWSALAYALVCFTHGSFWLNGMRLAESFGVFVFLILFRLYDDLANSEIDRHKLQRSYTKDSKTILLKRYFYLLYAGLILLLAFHEARQAILLISFLLLCEICYYVLFSFRKIRLLLPLLKYPFVVLVLGSQDPYVIFGLFLIFLIIEYRDEDVISKFMALPILFVAYALCYLNNQDLHVAIVFLILSIAALLVNYKRARYLLLFLYILNNVAL